MGWRRGIGIKDQMKAGFEAILPMIVTHDKQLELSPVDSTELSNIYESLYEKNLDHEGISTKIIGLLVETFSRPLRAQGFDCLL